MAENLTTTTEVDPAVAIFYDRVLLKRALPFITHDRFAQRRSIKRKSGNTMKFRRYASLSVATTPLTEGVTPPGSQLSKTDLTAQISWHGDFTHITDVVDMTVEDAVLTEASEVLGEQMGLTTDTLVRDVLCACASSTLCTGGGNTKTPTEIHPTGLRAVVRTLQGNNAKMISNVIVASSGFNTTPVRPAYFGILHTDLISDLETEFSSGEFAFIPTAKYPTQGAILEGEWGATGNVRWLVTSNAKTYVLTQTNYHCLVFGKDAYGVIGLEGGAAKNIVKAFGSGGTSDPLNQRATSGWKMPFACRILNDNFMHDLKASKEL